MLYITYLILVSATSSSESYLDVGCKARYKYNKLRLQRDMDRRKILPLKKHNLIKNVKNSTVSPSSIDQQSTCISYRRRKTYISLEVRRFLKVLNLIQPEFSVSKNSDSDLKVPKSMMALQNQTKKYIKHKMSWFLDAYVEKRALSMMVTLNLKIKIFVKELFNFRYEEDNYKEDTFISFIKKSKDIRLSSFKLKLCFSHVKFSEIFEKFIDRTYPKTFFPRSYINTELRKFRYFNIFPELFNIDMRINLLYYDFNTSIRIYIWIKIVNHISKELEAKLKEIAVNKIDIVDFESHEVLSNLYVCYVNMIYLLTKPRGDDKIFNTRRCLGDVITNLCVAFVDSPNKTCQKSAFLYIKNMKNSLHNFSALSFRLFITFNTLLLNNFLAKIPRRDSLESIEYVCNFLSKRIDFYFDNYKILNRKHFLKSYYSINEVQKFL